MLQTYRLIRVEIREQVFCVRLSETRLEEVDIPEFAEEMVALADNDGCRFLALSLGPQTPRCLFSVFLSRLVALRNAYLKRGGQMVLCQVGPQTFSAFKGCHLDGEFVFLPDFDAAVRYFDARKEKDLPT
jgi:hypothetical protein